MEGGEGETEPVRGVYGGGSRGVTGPKSRDWGWGEEHGGRVCRSLKYCGWEVSAC